MAFGCFLNRGDTSGNALVMKRLSDAALTTSSFQYDPYRLLSGMMLAGAAP